MNLYLRALIPGEGDGMTDVVQNTAKMSLTAISSLEGTDDPFPMALVEHLIECSNNAFEAQENGLLWM